MESALRAGINNYSYPKIWKPAALWKPVFNPNFSITTQNYLNSKIMLRSSKEQQGTLAVNFLEHGKSNKRKKKKMKRVFIEKRTKILNLNLLKKSS